VNFIPLDNRDLMLAALLVIGNALLSWRLRLGVERQLAVAAVRTTVQLTLIGFVLKALFDAVSPLWTSVAALVMIAFAGREVKARQATRLRGWWAYGLGGASMLFAGTLVTIFALTTQLQPHPWYHPRYSLPLLGMILGNTMTGLGLALGTLNQSAVQAQAAIEAQLALGETAFHSMQPQMRTAIRTGLIPIINAMSAAGVVSLPGMMTGQILSGIAPGEAVKYQVLIMFLIAGATGLSVLLAVIASTWRLSDDRHRLRLDRVHGWRDG